MPSSGKTTIGAELAKLLHKDFVDIDAQIVLKIGMPISNYFEQYGENAFKRIETEVTKGICWQKIILLFLLAVAALKTGKYVIFIYEWRHTFSRERFIKIDCRRRSPSF